MNKQLAFSFVWSLAYVIAVLVKRKRAPMHPGIPLGFDLVTALSLAGMGGLASALMITWGACDVSKSDECAITNRITATERTAQVLTFIDLIFHSILFVFACMACHKEKQLRKADKANAYVIELQQSGNEVPKV
ncbi:hypothetical protein AJ78_06870 [Emergomyces pasteurianus Ep9510]|uniref:MARVEL domain-containing protein n=1 Tax=Emergomyces pasteurianus Ep9510 TaxID=1447872 RepID=A0A1J9P7E9_9EURO|nr:hypothetical protein AJ78_06870 [Emergomyces pasteurianus Ep9510]